MPVCRDAMLCTCLGVSLFCFLYKVCADACLVSYNCFCAVIHVCVCVCTLPRLIFSGVMCCDMDSI